jgi:hypothetical protein
MHSEVAAGNLDGPLDDADKIRMHADQLAAAGRS